VCHDVRVCACVSVSVCVCNGLAVAREKDDVVHFMMYVSRCVRLCSSACACMCVYNRMRHIE